MSAFTASLNSERAKVTSTRAWFWLALILFLYIAVISGGIAAVFLASGALEQLGSLGSEGKNYFVYLLYSFSVTTGYVFPLLLGVLAVTGEFRHRTITPTFLLTPKRSTVLASKFVVLFGWGAIFGLIGIVASVGPAAVILGSAGHDVAFGSGDTYLLLLRMLLAMALWAVIGIGVGTLIPNQAGAVIVVLAFTQFVEPILRALSMLWTPSAEIAKYLPGSASDSLVGYSFLGFTGSDPTASSPGLEWWAGALVLLAYAAITAAIGSVTTWRKDIS